MNSIRIVLAVLATFVSINAFAWQLTDVMECKRDTTRTSPVYDCTGHDVPRQLPYNMVDGSVRVVSSRQSALCINGMCTYGQEFAAQINGSVSNEYAGQISLGGRVWFILHVGYYVGEGEDGRPVTYREGTGPKVGEPAAGALPVTEPLTEADKCLDSWVNETRKEIGEYAAITADQISEWESWCLQGKYPQ